MSVPNYGESITPIESPKKSNRTGITIIIILILLFLCCCCLVLVLVGWNFGDQLLNLLGIQY